MPIDAPMTAAARSAVRLLDEGSSEWGWGWVAKLEHRGGRHIRPHTANVVMILKRDPRWAGVLGCDERGRIYKRRVPPWHPEDRPADAAPGPWTHLDTSLLCLFLKRDERYGIEVLPSIAYSAVKMAARGGEKFPEGHRCTKPNASRRDEGAVFECLECGCMYRLALMPKWVEIEQPATGAKKKRRARRTA